MDKNIGIEHWDNKRLLEVLAVPVEEAWVLLGLRLPPGHCYQLQEPMPGIPNDQERYRRDCVAVGVEYVEHYNPRDGSSEHGPSYDADDRHRFVHEG